MWDEIESLYYKCYRGYKKVADIPYEIKWFIQRGKRGYADCDLWSLDSYLSGFLPKALRKMAEINHGCPDEFVNCDPKYYIKDSGKHDCDACKEDNGHCVMCKDWEEVIIKMAEAFEAYDRVQDDDYPELELWCNAKRKSSTEKDDFLYLKSEDTEESKRYWNILEEKRKKDWDLWEKDNYLFLKYFGNLWD